MKNGYTVYERTEYYPLVENIAPHTHDYHEIFMLLEGNVDFFVEGTKFPLNAGDAVVINANDPHTKLVINKRLYKCFVIYIENSFFRDNNCAEYKKIFTSHQYTEHKINAETTHSSGFFSAYKRLKEYSDNFTNIENAITNSLLVEMLHILNNNSEFSNNYVANVQVQKILEYVDSNYCTKISLEDMQKKLYISKYYICKIFKTYTGFTINNYIANKRIAKVGTLIEQGSNITSACIEAGFCDYSSFYKIFIKKMGMSPKKYYAYHRNV